jgi:hypothetical protein
MHPFAAAGAALIVAAVVAGCGGDPDPEPSPAASELTQKVTDVRADAVAAGATEAQLAILEEAAANGELTMEQLLAARDKYAECLAAVGFTLVDLGVTDTRGFPYPEYSVSTGSAPESDDASTQCENEHFFFVDYVYQTQASSREGQDSQFEAAMPALIACLTAGGLTIPSDVSADELKRLMLEDVQAAIEANPEALLDGPVHSCLDEVGLNGF